MVSSWSLVYIEKLFQLADSNHGGGIYNTWSIKEYGNGPDPSQSPNTHVKNQNQESMAHKLAKTK